MISVGSRRLRTAAFLLYAAVLFPAAVLHAADPVAGKEDGRQPAQDPADVIEDAVFTVEFELDKDQEQIQQLNQSVEKAASKAPKAAVSQAKAEVTWAVAKLNQAREALEKARTARNEAEKQVLLKEARLKAEDARGWMNRVHAAVSPSPAAGAATSPQRGDGVPFRKDLAWWQINEAAGLGQSGEGAPAFGEGERGDPIAYDPGTQVLTTPSGQTVNVAPLADALRRVSSDSQTPVFEEKAVPGSAPVQRLTEEAGKILASAEKREELKKIGGVSLEVTLDLLAFLGVPEFRRTSPDALEGPAVLISLSSLYERLAPYASSVQSWEDTPEALRFPGGVDRLHGIVLSPAEQDVFLVGSSADVPENRIDVDALIIGLRSVWREGITPRVSLDPLPDDPGGLQYSRVSGVPADSVFAKTMLDADYAMKRIMLGLEPDLGRFQELNARLIPDDSAGLDASRQGARFWLTPVPLGAGDVQVSTTSRSWLFASGVQSLTEGVRVTAGGFDWLGTADEIHQDTARHFTELYPELERSGVIRPAGIFARLHGLVDVVTLSKLLREIGVDYPVLRNIAELPVRRLQGAEAVPTYYPGVRVTIGIRGPVEHYLTGGAVMRARGTRRSLDYYQDAVTRTLEHAADTFPRAQAFATTVPINLVLSRPGGGNLNETDGRILAGRRALEAGQYRIARDHFQVATGLNPFDAEAWSYLGSAQSLLGEHEDARVAAAQALSLDPSDATTGVHALHVGLRADPEMDVSSWDGVVKREVSYDYTDDAYAAMRRERADAARRAADIAIRLWADNADAYAVRGIAGTWTGDWDGAIADFTRNIELVPRDLNAHLLRAAAYSEKGLYGDAMRDIDEALAMAAEPIGYAYALRGDVLSKTDHLHEAISDYTRALVVEPGNASIHVSRGIAYAFASDIPNAISDLNEAVRIDPNLGEAYAGRAIVYYLTLEFDKAWADVHQAQALGVQLGPGFLEQLRTASGRTG